MEMAKLFILEWGGFGANKGDFSFVTVEFEKVFGEPGSDFLEAIGEGGWREGHGGFSGQVELGIICITMELTIILTEKMAKREEIDNEQEGSKDRTLGYTRGEGGRMGSNGENKKLKKEVLKNDGGNILF